MMQDCGFACVPIHTKTFKTIPTTKKCNAQKGQIVATDDRITQRVLFGVGVLDERAAARLFIRCGRAVSIWRLNAGWTAATLHHDERATQHDDGARDAQDHRPLELRHAKNGLFLAAGLRAVNCLSIWTIPATSIWMQVLMIRAKSRTEPDETRN
eukprot:4596113-Amphidinium_carterae.1